MQQSYGIEVMRMLNFPKEVVHIAENYLEYYECDEQADAKVNKLSDVVKDQISEIYSEME